MHFTFLHAVGLVTLASSRPCPWASGHCRQSCLGLCWRLAGRRRGGGPPFRGSPLWALGCHGRGNRRGCCRGSCCRRGCCRRRCRGCCRRRCWPPLERIGPVSAVWPLAPSWWSRVPWGQLSSWLESGWLGQWLVQPSCHPPSWPACQLGPCRPPGWGGLGPPPTGQWSCQC